ncbi:MAG TPA: hypothetical protein PKY30_10685, partial [Myxococcota bacterium]|nr:hypothetical protein [Myxococcota bacterium]
PGVISFSVVGGQVGGKAPKSSCGGMELPVVAVSALLNTNNMQLSAALVTGINQFLGGNGVTAPTTSDVSTMLTTALQMMDNVGNTNTYRAMNYAMLHAGGMYGVWWCYQNGKDPATGADSATYTLTGVSTAPARVQGDRTLIDVIFSYFGNSTSVAWSVTVDVSTGIPFFASLRPTRYYSRP